MEKNHLMQRLDQTIKKQFDQNLQILSLDEYFGLLTKKPKPQLRGVAQYMLDMMDWRGKTEIESGVYSFKLFDNPVAKVVGQEEVQTQIYRGLKTFARLGISNKLLLLHGPNGSAKSSIVRALMLEMENYSQSPEGAVYSFHWVFPVDKVTKGAMGLGSSTVSDVRSIEGESYAKLAETDLLCRLSCELKDHPLLLVPQKERKEFLKNLLQMTEIEFEKTWSELPLYLKEGDLCHRCKQIYETLLNVNNGDIKKVFRHIQVERFYHSARYRKSLVTIEPQMHVDAHYSQISYNRSLGSLPASLQSLNLFTLGGELIDANRGIVEFSDLLKRPIDSFKYLLMACETGSVNVGQVITHLDTVFIGSANELQLDAFKEFPDFMSFKARIELIRVPYLLKWKQEQEVYSADLSHVMAEKHVSPHVAEVLSLWSVLTRLKKPNSIYYAPTVSHLVAHLKPFEKVKLYDSGEIPSGLGPEDRKILKSTLRRIREEYSAVPQYEGRMGASAREMKSILHSASQNKEFHCLSPLAIFRELDEFVKRVSEYEFLRGENKDGYHDCAEFIEVARSYYLSILDHEVRESIGLYDSQQWEEFLKKYVQNIAHVLKKEKVKNPVTGAMDDPDYALIGEFEKIVEAPSAESEKESFRNQMISAIGVWSLDHPKETVIYAKVFPDFWIKLEKYYYETQKALLMKIQNALLVYDSKSGDEGADLAKQTVDQMVNKRGYCQNCAKEVISYLLKQKY